MGKNLIAGVTTLMRRLVDLTGELPWIQYGYGCHASTHPLDWRNLVPRYAIRDYEPSDETETRGEIEYLNREVLPPGREVRVGQRGRGSGGVLPVRRGGGRRTRRHLLRPRIDRLSLHRLVEAAPPPANGAGRGP